MKILCYIIYILIILVGAALSIFLPPSFALYVVSTFFTGIAAFVIVLAMLLTTCEYRSFLASFETLRTIITQMSQSRQFNDNTLIYVADMIDANQKLAEIQGSKKAWGGWCMYPDSVMDITPIGME